MSFSLPLGPLSLLSTGNSGHQYKAVVASSAANDNGYAIVATRGGAVNGVIQDDSTQAVFQEIQVLGITKMAAGDSSGTATAINQGDVVVASSQGQAVASTASGLHRVGYALESLTTGSTGVIAVLLSMGLT